MKNASRVVTAVFGAIAAVAGLEHGIGEVLQGSVRPGGLWIVSWPDSSFFANLGGEPAITVVPSLLVSGILTMVMSVVLLAWSVGFAHRRHGGMVLLGICGALFLVGGGFGPPAVGAIIAVAALRARSSHAWAVRVPRVRRALATAWPWVLGCGVVAWLWLMPGTSVVSYAAGIGGTGLVTVTILCAFATLALSIITGFARDARPRARV